MPGSSQGLPQRPRALYTVGHSNLELLQFLELLKNASVELLVDVRSRPQSGRFPQFSQPAFEVLLQREGILYLFLGEELGGRPDDQDAYRLDGIVDYRMRRKSYAFGAGLERVLRELQSRTLALMCAEEDPLECHRFLMIGPELVASGVQPLHIRKGSKIERQEEAETRLLQSNGFGDVAANTLFPEARAEALEKAYELQAHKFAFRVDPAVVQMRGVYRKSRFLDLRHWLSQSKGRKIKKRILRYLLRLVRTHREEQRCMRHPRDSVLVCQFLHF